MAGIKGQPSAKPSQVKSPVPETAPAYSELDDLGGVEAGAAGNGYAELDSVAAVGPAQTLPVSEEIPEVVGEQDLGMAGVATSFIPPVMGLAGGILGSPGGPVGMVAGAALGGAAGQGYREWIEQNLLGKTPADPNQQLMDVAEATAVEGAGQAIGLGVAKGVSKLAKTKAGSAVTDYVAEQARGPIAWAKSLVQAERDGVLEPVTKLIRMKSTPLNAEQSGDVAKQLLTSNIKGKYGPFIQAYEDLDNVAQALPFKDRARYEFTQKLRSWAVDKSGDEYKAVKGLADALDAADNGAKFTSELKRINGTIRQLSKLGDTELATTLKAARDQATNFFEGETTKLAARIQAGKATPEEMAFVQRIAQQRGIMEPDPSKYAKSLAKDYLNSVDKIKKDYAGFRSFLSDVGEQTKLKAETRGPMAFLNNLDDVPSEKLIERMFDPKNAAALRRMKAETPEVFEQVVKSKMSRIVQESSTEGTLDVKAFRKAINALPESTRQMLVSADELKMINQTVDNPRVQRLVNLEATGENLISKWIGQVVEASRIGGKAVLPKPITYGVGRAVSAPLVDAFRAPMLPPEEQQ